MAQGQSGEDGGKRQLGSGTPAARTPMARRRRRVPSTPMEAPDVEAFLQQAARIVLRMKGLAGDSRVEDDKEDSRDSA